MSRLIRRHPWMCASVLLLAGLLIVLVVAAGLPSLWVVLNAWLQAAAG